MADKRKGQQDGMEWFQTCDPARQQWRGEEDLMMPVSTSLKEMLECIQVNNRNKIIVNNMGRRFCHDAATNRMQPEYNLTGGFSGGVSQVEREGNNPCPPRIGQWVKWQLGNKQQANGTLGPHAATKHTWGTRRGRRRKHSRSPTSGSSHHGRNCIAFQNICTARCTWKKAARPTRRGESAIRSSDVTNGIQSGKQKKRMLGADTKFSIAVCYRVSHWKCPFAKKGFPMAQSVCHRVRCATHLKLEKVKRSIC